MHGVRHLEVALASLKTRHYICLLAAVSLFSVGGEAQKQKAPEGYSLVWSDEFNGKDGSQAYGRFETRIKLPAGQGMWPAFWMLGENIDSVGWPKCGEIDIMENIGKEPGINHGSLHGPSSTNATSDLTATITLPAGQKLSDDFHVYTAEWEPGTVRFYLDANLYATFTSAQWPAGGTWVFHQPLFLIPDVAVGGDWPGSPDATTAFPRTLLVDYGRVYKGNKYPAASLSTRKIFLWEP